MFSYHWDWTSYVTVFTGQEQLRYWAKLYWRFSLKVFRWTSNWGFMGWSSTYIPPVQALFLFLGSRFIALLMEIQYASGADSGVSSLSFTMLLRVSLPFLCLSSSCWREYSRIKRYSPRFWLLYYVSPPDSWDSGFLRLGSLLWLLRTPWLLQVS
jgi:hypothetical protein